MAAPAEEKTELAELPANFAAELKKLLAADSKSVEFKKKNVTGTVGKFPIAGYNNEWVKSDKYYQDVDEEIFRGYFKSLVECQTTDKTVTKVEITHKAADGYPTGYFLEKKMGFMISNRDIHATLTRYAMPKDLDIPEGFKDLPWIEVWADFPEKQEGYKAPAKGVVRMKMLAFGMRKKTDKGHRVLDYVNYDVGGMLPSKVINMYLGNPDEYELTQSYLENVKKNGGKFVK